MLDHLGNAIFRIAGGSRTKILLCVMPVTSFVSSFMNNTTTTAILMPADPRGLPARASVSPSKVLIPLAYASMLGGPATLIGTSTNVAASGYMRSAGMEPMTMFELLPIGLVVTLVGLVYMIAFGHRLLPAVAETSLVENYAIREYLSEVVLTPARRWSARRSATASLSQMELSVRAIQRGDRRALPRAAHPPRGGGPPDRPEQPRRSPPGQGHGRHRDPRRPATERAGYRERDTARSSRRS